jgi:hypothetical protein
LEVIPLTFKLGLVVEVVFKVKVVFEVDVDVMVIDLC